MTAPVIQFKRGALVNLPGLQAGEPGFTTDSYDLYVGLTSETSTNKFFGSHRYWTKDSSSTGSGVNFVEGTSNGSQYITLKSPDSLSGIGTYTLPDTTTIVDGYFLKVGSDGTLSWDTVGGTNGNFTSPTLSGITTINDSLDVNAHSDFSGITTFSNTTNNTLGNENTGAIQIDGGVGIAKNLTVKENLYVGGYSEFVGITTFKGGTINLGDGSGDNINVGGEFTSGLYPDSTNTYDFGDESRQWRNASFAGVVTATTFSGNASSADQIKTVNSGNANASHYVTFVNSDNNSATNETVYTDDGIYYNPGTNTFTTQHATFTGNVEVQGSISAAGGTTVVGTISTATRAATVDTTATSTNATYYVPFVDTFAGESGETIRVGAGLSINPATGNVGVSSILSVGNANAVNAFIKAGGGSNALYLYSNGDVSFQSKAIVNQIRSSNNASTLITLNDLDATFANNVSIAGITTISSSAVVGTSLSAPTVKVATLQHSNGTQAGTIDSSGNIVASQNLTVSGNLYVNGSTTQVNTSSMTVEDRTIELGQVDGSAPGAPTTWDLGVLFNYNASGAKKSGVIWEHAAGRFRFGSQVTDGGGTDNDSPQITVSTYAPIEIGSLWVNDCAGQSEVIGCSNGVRTLQNITIDCGTF